MLLSEKEPVSIHLSDRAGPRQRHGSDICNMTNTLIVADNHEALAAPIQAAELPDLELHCAGDADAAKAYCAAAEVLFGAPDLLVPLLPLCPRLRWVQSTWAGVTPLVSTGRRDYLLTGVKGIFGPLMAEYVIGWLLAFERRILERAAHRSWDDSPDPGLAGQTVGIMGTGSIGARVAESCRHFGLRVHGLNSDGRAVPGFARCFAPAERMEFAQGLDYLVVLLPQVGSTNGLVDADLLQRLQPGALLINGGRGNSIDQQALLAALDSGRLRAAVLDVLPEEPLPPGSPLWQVPNLYLTSHTAAPTHPAAVVEIFIDNYRRFAAGQALRNLVDFNKGY